MRSYAYYPGCSLKTSATEFDSSTRAVFEAIGVDLREIPDWSCCGSSAAHKVDRDMATAIAGRNLVLAANIGDIVAPCASCFLSLKEATIELEHESPARMALRDAGFEYAPGSVRVLSAVEALYDLQQEGQFEGKITNPLKGLKVASYYGCLLVRPAKIAKFDDPENPVSLDKMVEATGATPVEWSHKTECCGNSYIMIDRDMSLRLVTRILNAAIDSDADIIVTACPMCQTNVADRHNTLRQKYGLKDSIPVIYFTQLLGLALGIDIKDLELSPSIANYIRQRQYEAVSAVKEVD